MNRYFPTAAALVLGTLLCACTQPAPAPTPPPPTPAPTPTPDQYPGKTTHVTLFEYPTPRGCGVVAIPYYAYVRTGGTIIWDIVNDACPKEAKPTITFEKPEIIEISYDAQTAKGSSTGGGGKGTITGTVKGAASAEPYRYTVTLGRFVHDPEIEIWP